MPKPRQDAAIVARIGEACQLTGAILGMIRPQLIIPVTPNRPAMANGQRNCPVRSNTRPVMIGAIIPATLPTELGT